METRREFVLSAAAAGVAWWAVGPGATAAGGRSEAATEHGPAQGRKLRLLILGGTGFIGPWQVRHALARGHAVTIFNRGKSAPGLFPGVEELLGDRAEKKLDALRGREWDAVIDNSASRADAPEWVRDAAALLRDAAGRYLFVSTRSVYRDLSTVPATIDAPVYTKETTPGWTEGRPFPYGLAKALAEAEARAAFGDRAIVVRPGLIAGPGDTTDRFTYWAVRVERGGEILAPGDPLLDRVQFIDVRDFAEWCVRLVEDRASGTFMAVGPGNGRSMAELLHGIAACTTAPLSWTWVPHAFLLEHGLRPYQEIPVWRPPIPGFEGFARFDLRREIAAGLRFRSLADTTSATLAFHHERPEAERRLKAGPSPEKEASVLEAWHAAASKGR